MHGEEETTWAPRLVFAVVVVAAAALCGWLLLGGGLVRAGAWCGRDWTPGDPWRRALLFAFAAVCSARFLLLVGWLLRRRMNWDEALSVSAYLLAFYLAFTLLGGTLDAPPGALDGLAIALYVAGAALNTAGEVQRRFFKRQANNRGRLYTGGVFRLVRHPNYLGDILWMSGWALATRSGWAALVPLASALGFVVMHVPALTRHMEKRYGAAWAAYASRTRRLIPFVY